MDLKELVLSTLERLAAPWPHQVSASQVYVALLKAQVRVQDAQVVAELNRLVAEGVTESKKTSSCSCSEVWWLKKN